MFPDDGKYRQKISRPKELPNLFAQIDEFETAPRRPAGNVEANQGAEPHTVDPDEIGQVQYDSLGFRDQLADLRVENIVHTRHQLAVALDDNSVAGTSDFKCERTGCFVRHSRLTLSELLDLAGERFSHIKPEIQTMNAIRATPHLLLPALLSQVLVAFTIEFDNEFEHQVPHRTTNHGATAGSRHVPWLVSRVMFSNFMRFVDEQGTTIRDLQRLLRMPAKTMRIWVTRMSEWWGYIVVEPKASKRIHPDAVVIPTPGGRRALEVWRTLEGLIEKRWRERLGGDNVDRLHERLSAIVGQIDVDLPDSLPILGYGLFSSAPEPAEAAVSTRLSLPSLLSRVLLWFAIEFERGSEVSLAISANVLRLPGEEGTAVRDLPRMAGVSKEAIATSLSFLGKRGYVTLKSRPAASGGKLLVLTSKGRSEQETYRQRVWAIEERWQAQFGSSAIGHLRESLEGLVGDPAAQRSPLSRGLDPYPDGWRASVPKPEGLPHYPMLLHRGGFPDGS
jgi:DNA-binding MarR family transcriptional regulator